MHVTTNGAVGVKYDCYQDTELDECINTDYTYLEPSHTFHKHREPEDVVFPPWYRKKEFLSKFLLSLREARQISQTIYKHLDKIVYAKDKISLTLLDEQAETGFKAIIQSQKSVGDDMEELGSA